MIEQISFHDPDGVVFYSDDRVLRRVKGAAAIRLREFLIEPISKELVSEGYLPETHELSKSESSDLDLMFPCAGQASDGVWFSHKKIAYPSYAHEWVPEMLLEAAMFTLALTRRLNAAGWDIKDASVSNVLFNAANPVFIDFCSIVRRSDQQPYWRPKGQFERHFILPLLAYMHLGLSPDRIHMAYPDGLAPVDLCMWIGYRKWFDRSLIKHAALPNLFAKRNAKLGVIEKVRNETKEVCFYMQTWQLNSLGHTLRKIEKKLPAKNSLWHDYVKSRKHYTANAVDQKRKIVTEWLKSSGVSVVLDLGANTGEFSLLSAEAGAKVVSIEKDMDAARLAYSKVKSNAADCLVLLGDLANPSPAMGWKYREKKTLDVRLAGKVDCVLVLALIHHWLVSAGIPLDEIVDQLFLWTSRFLVIEYVPPSDPLFQSISKQRGLDFSWLTQQEFKARLQDKFQIHSQNELDDSGRMLFLCERI